MNRYKVFFNGALVHQYNNTAELTFSQWPGATQTSEPIVEEGPPLDTTVPSDWYLTPYAFVSRFTEDEWADFDLASIDVPTGPPENRRLQSKLRLFRLKIQLATYVNLRLDSTITGLGVLNALGLLTAARVDTILNTLPTDEERYNGR